MAAPLYSATAVLAAKVEGTAGTAESLANSDAAYIVGNVAWTNDPSEIQRFAQGVYGSLPSQVSPRTGAVSFDIEFAGKGSSGSPDWAEVLLRGCRWSDATTPNTFIFDSASETTLTIGWYCSGRLHVLSGCRGTWSVGATANGTAVLSFNFIGNLSNESDASVLTPTYPTVRAPVFAGATFTYGGVAPILRSFSIAVNNALTLLPDATLSRGYRHAAVTNCDPSATLEIESPLVATKNWPSDLRAAGTAALSIVIGSATNNTMTIAAAAAQVVDVQPAPADGYFVDNITLRLTGVSPVSIAFT